MFPHQAPRLLPSGTCPLRLASKFGAPVREPAIRTLPLFFKLIGSLVFVLGAIAADAALPNAVLHWNAAFTGEMKRDTLPPAMMARNLALLHSALWDAQASNPAPSEKACHLIAYKISSRLLPGHVLEFDKLLQVAYPGRIEDADRDFADKYVHKTLSTAAGDGSSVHSTYTARGLPGSWFRTAPFFRPAELPHWGKVRPFYLPRANAFRPAGPPALSDARYAMAWQEVYVFGGKSSSRRTADQTASAKFWSDFSYTETPVGHWNTIARSIAQSKKLPLKDCALLMHLLSAALSDTAIACWDAKYAYDSWRPLTAIQKADTDENAATTPDASWEPLLNTPNHPEYVSGHSAFSGAAGMILAAFFETSEIAFEVGNDTLPDSIRKFDRFEDCVKECSQSRIYGGIHFRFSCDDGIVLGEQVADYIWNRHKGLLSR